MIGNNKDKFDVNNEVDVKVFCFNNDIKFIKNSLSKI